MASSNLAMKSDPVLNFCLPISTRLERDRVTLVPFKVSEHGAVIVQVSIEHSQICKWTVRGPWNSVQEFANDITFPPSDATSFVLYAVFSKFASDEAKQAAMDSAAEAEKNAKQDLERLAARSRVTEEGEMAGTIGLMDTSPRRARAEIAIVFTFPKFQRSHITTHSIGLLLNECLTPAHQGGLGLRRVWWEANSQNTASRRAAERMGFSYEGTKRWEYIVPMGKQGNETDVLQHQDLLKGGVKGYEDLQHEMSEGQGRHADVLSMCWDDWLLNGKKEFVQKMMGRR